jgi:hypothetical protein
MDVLFIQFTTNMYTKSDVRFYLRAWNIGEVKRIELLKASAQVTMDYFYDTERGNYAHNELMIKGNKIPLYLDVHSNERWILSKYESQ